MTIEDIFFNLYGFYPDAYYLHLLRNGEDADKALQDIDKKINDIWRCEKNGGFYPVDEDDIPESFI